MVSEYRIAGYFRGVLIFVIFMVNMSHEIFHPRNLYRSLQLASHCSFRYLRPVAGNALDPHGPLSQHVPRAVISEANDQLRKEVVTKKRGSYRSHVGVVDFLQHWPPI